MARPFPSKQFHRLGVESELVLRIGKPVPVLAEQADSDVLIDCVDAIAAGFELVEDRAADYQRLDGFSIIAENSWNMGMVLGHPVAMTAARNLADLEGNLFINDQLVGTASSADVMQGPLSVLAWLARFADTMNFDLRPGQWIMDRLHHPHEIRTAEPDFSFPSRRSAPGGAGGRVDASTATFLCINSFGYSLNLGSLSGREPATRMCTKRLALCVQPGSEATLETPDQRAQQIERIKIGANIAAGDRARHQAVDRALDERARGIEQL